LQTLATAHRAAGRALQNLPFAVKVGLASCVLVVASLVVVWMHDAGFRDRLYRTVTGYRRPSDARFDLARGGQCVDGCASGGARQGGCIPRDVHVTYNSRGVLRHHRILESALSPGYVCRLASLALPPAPPQAAAAPPPVAEATSRPTFLARQLDAVWLLLLSSSFVPQNLFLCYSWVHAASSPLSSANSWPASRGAVVCGIPWWNLQRCICMVDRTWWRGSSVHDDVMASCEPSLNSSFAARHHMIQSSHH